MFFCTSITPFNVYQMVKIVLILCGYTALNWVLFLLSQKRKQQCCSNQTQKRKKTTTTVTKTRTKQLPQHCAIMLIPHFIKAVQECVRGNLNKSLLHLYIPSNDSTLTQGNDSTLGFPFHQEVEKSRRGTSMKRPSQLFHRKFTQSAHAISTNSYK